MPSHKKNASIAFFLLEGVTTISRAEISAVRSAEHLARDGDIVYSPFKYRETEGIYRANLEAYALAQGLEKTFSEMSQGEQMMLRYQYLMQATADAQGDFARTSDGYANAMRKIQTNWENVKTTIGNAILPMVNEAVAGLNRMFDALFPAQTGKKSISDQIGEIEAESAAKIEDISTTAQEARALIGELEKMQEVGEGITLKTNLREFINLLKADFGDMQKAIDEAEQADFGGSLAEIARNIADSTGGDPTKWNLLFDAISQKLKAATDATLDDKGQLAKWMQAAADAADDLGGDYSDMWASFLQTLGEDAGAAVQAFANASTSAENLKNFAENANKLSQETSGKWGNLSEALNGFIESIATNDYVTTLTDLAGALGEATGVETSEWETLLTTIAGDLKDAKSAIDENGEPVKSFFQTAKEAAQGLGEEAYGRWSNLLGVLGENAPAFLDALADSDAVVNFGTLATNANSLSASAGKNWEDVNTAIANLANSAKEKGYTVTISELADALAKPTGVSSEAWEGVLKGVADSLKAHWEEISEYGADTESFLFGASEYANNLGSEAGDIWGKFLTAVGDNAGAVVTALANSQDSAVNLGIFATKASNLSSTAGDSWSSLLTALADTTNLTNFGTEAGTAGNKIEEFAKQLDSADNKQKIEGFNGLVETLKNNAEALVGVTGLENAEEVKAWLGSIADAANSLAPETASGWESIFNLFSQGLPGLEEGADGKQISDTVKEQVEDSKGYLQEFGDAAEQTAQKESYWLETLKRLTTTIPGLSSIINTQTGEIKGGLSALTDYVDQWEKLSKQGVLADQLAKEEQLLQDRFPEMAKLKVDVVTAEARLKNLRDQYNQLSEEARNGFGAKLAWADSGGGRPNLTDEEQKAVKLAGEIQKAEDELAKSQAELTKVSNDYAEALAILHERQQAVRQSTEELNESGGGAFVMTDKQKEAAKAVIEVLDSQLTALADHVESVSSSIKSSLDSTIKGFSEVKSSLQTTKQAMEELAWVDEETRGEDEKWNKANNELNDYKNGVRGLAVDMKAGLESQMKFLDDYLANLEKAQKMGLSGDLLSALADGTADSATYLAELVDPNNSKIAQDINALYSQVNAKKEQLAQTLTDQQLSVDEQYKAMVKVAEEAVKALDMGQEAGENAGKTAAGIVSGLTLHMDEIEGAVDSILKTLNRLNQFKVNINVGVNGGTSGGNTRSGAQITPLAIGMDYVPFDGFLASLHEGEGVLTAEENRIWQRFRAGSTETRNSLDYDTLGSVMRDSVKPGGNVYLDGRTVGKVVSDMQGQQYRQLQRSGWQA